MTEKDSWKLIDELFNKALDLPVNKRKDFLRQECADPDIRDEVELLLESDATADGFIETSALEQEARTLAREERPILSFQHIGDYEVLELIGTGGMGSVHKARHSKTGKIVALKQLHPHFVRDPHNVRRFYREAKAIKALNHPNVAQLVEVSNDEVIHYIAMEYVEGCTLEETIRRGHLDIKRVLKYAKQTALALKAAHSKGILHRDIKPSNLLIQTDDTLKVLDFGLAKIFTDSVYGTAAFSADSITKTGILVGTVNYMSPEQISGKTIDQRSDIFSLGVVIYEMATRRPPFPGDSLAEKITAVLDSPPIPLERYIPESPEFLNTIITKCLEKDPGRRYQSAHALIREINLSLGLNIDEDLDKPFHRIFDRIRSWIR